MLKQQEFSEMVGISTNYLSDVERGKKSIRLDKLVLIMNELQCSADDLFVNTIDCRIRSRYPRFVNHWKACIRKAGRPPYKASMH